MSIRDTRCGRDLIDLGKEEGRREVWTAAILDTLECRFGVVPEEVEKAVLAIPGLAQLRSVHRAALRAEDLATFRASLI